MTVGVDRGGQDVPVVGVGEVELVDQVLVAGHGHVADRVVHRTAGAIQTCGVEVGAVGAQVVEHLIENPICPLRVHQPREPDPDQHVPERGGVEYVGVADHDHRHQAKPSSRVSVASASAAAWRRASSSRR